ncbi:SCO2322 family protein [Streptomyces radicis]|uniref:SCO2322 family protein n=1 Tax=Streptomyces radicis TaxID=1750517 RepID=UPI0016000505|nr:SCO2322 family protein [Streptomyces radicis]
MRRHPWTRTAVAGALTAGFALALALPTAQAATPRAAPTAPGTPGALAAPADEERGGYVYWSFWLWDADEARWVYATEGPGTRRPDDGDVLGFRFTESASPSDVEQPRDPGDFAATCGAVNGGDAPEGERVALVIDFGTTDAAPPGVTPPEPRAECAPLPDGGTAAEALAATAEPLRYNADALLCAIAGYPETGCADRLPAGDGADAAAADEGEGADGGGGGTLAWVAGVGLVALLGGAAWARARRRRA